VLRLGRRRGNIPHGIVGGGELHTQARRGRRHDPFEGPEGVVQHLGDPLRTLGAHVLQSQPDTGIVYPRVLLAGLHGSGYSCTRSHGTCHMPPDARIVRVPQGVEPPQYLHHLGIHRPASDGSIDRPHRDLHQARRLFGEHREQLHVRSRFVEPEHPFTYPVPIRCAHHPIRVLEDGLDRTLNRALRPLESLDSRRDVDEPPPTPRDVPRYPEGADVLH
jgi:hypothetical protein